MVFKDWLDNENYAHSIVKHNENEFVSGNIYTNTIEGFWSHFKKMVFGIYHSVSKKHLQRYIDEEVFRWNTREMPESVRFIDMFRKSVGLFTYENVLNAA